MEFKDLTPEMQEKLKGCNTAEEVQALVVKEGIELSEEELDAISGGNGWKDSQRDRYMRPF